jgi:hypothetical protein
VSKQQGGMRMLMMRAMMLLQQRPCTAL